MITLDSSYKQQTLICLMLCFVSLIAFSCDDENDSQCSTDQDCIRGQLCISNACSVVTCESISQCPGTGRTCLSDLNQCSAKECGDELNGVSLQCDAGLVCNMSGAYLYSCSSANGPTACTMDIDCMMASEGTSCCNGSCASMCDTPIIPMDMGTGGDTPPVDMMIPTPITVNLCTPCTNEAICTSLGEGAKCTAIGEGNFCTSACGDDTDCPTGFNCFSTLGQCIPSNFECAACQQTPCEAGQFCNINSGECGPPQGLCGNCSEDAACADGRVCRTIGMGPACVQACSDMVACPADMTCTDGGCIPNSGVCDPCAGTCSGATPYCIEEEARCAECGPTSPCAEGLRCDLMTYTCTDALPNGMCVVDTDCQGGGLCFNGTCVECFQDSDCPARNTCNTNSFTCEYSACGGVECQTGSTCDASSGRCTPGCNTNMDCVLPDVMDCNTTTGQCYYIDGSCELGGDAVCAPGGQCMPNAFSFLDPTLPAQCTCAKEDPTDPLSADRIPCHTGQTCTDLSSILGDLGLEFDATCGEGLF
jgi:Cys-rich repeat protein